MIWETLSFITNKLNNTLRNRYNIPRDLVKLASPAGADSQHSDMDNKILLTLVNVEPEYFAGDKKNLKQQSGSADLYLNLYILVSAYSAVENYEQSLKMLAGIISFFQSNAVLSSQSETGIPVGVDKLNFEVVRLSLNEQSSLWTSLGASYLPSVLYKMRLLRFKKEDYSPAWPFVTGIKQEE